MLIGRRMRLSSENLPTIATFDYFQSLEKFHEQGLPCKLPARLEQP